MAASEEPEARVTKCLIQEPWKCEMVLRVIANTQPNNGTLVTLIETEDEIQLVLWEQHASPRRATQSE